MRGEGILAALRRLEKRFGQWFYARRDLTVPIDQRDRVFERLLAHPPSHLATVPVVEVKTLDGVKLIGRDESWLLFRRSGTEPIVRVYAESPSARQVNRLLEFGVQLFTPLPRKSRVITSGGGSPHSARSQERPRQSNRGTGFTTS